MYDIIQILTTNEAMAIKTLLPGSISIANGPPNQEIIKLNLINFPQEKKTHLHHPNK